MIPSVEAMKPTVHETFGYPALTSALWDKWDNTFLGYDWGNIEAEQVTVEDGELRLSMTRRTAPVVHKSDGRERWFDVGYATTAGRLSIEHGAIEVRAKLPADPGVSAGVWSGIWMRPEDKSIGGEIDLAETYGDLGDDHSPKATVGIPDRFESTVHWDQSGTDKKTVRAVAPTSPLSEWHTYGVVKTADSITVYFDGQEVHQWTQAEYGDKFTKAFPPGARFHLRLCLQAGSAYWGKPNAQTADESVMAIDSVRVWDFDGVSHG